MIEKAVLNAADKGTLSCRKAFSLADELRVPQLAIGKTADALGIKLIKCQMGLFGQRQGEKVITLQPSLSRELQEKIEKSLVHGRLSCKNAWEIAAFFNMSKMEIGTACETLKIRISQCQLGAF